jgi:HEAT repeat protein
MRGHQYQYRGVVFLVLTVLSGIISPFIVTTEIFAQTPSTQMQCSEVEIKNYIQKLSNGEPSIYNALVACKDKAIPELIKALNQNKQVRIMLITALGEIGSPDAILPLSDLLANEKHWNVRAAIIFAFSNFGKQGVPSLITVLKDKDWYIRCQAANALTEIGSDAEDAIPALNDAVKDENENVRFAAMKALVVIKKQETNFMSVFEEDREDSSTSRVESAIINAPPSSVDTNVGIGSVNGSVNVSTSRAKPVIKPSSQRASSVISLTQQSKPPLICRVTSLRNIFKWKCPQNQRGK